MKKTKGFVSRHPSSFKSADQYVRWLERVPLKHQQKEFIRQLRYMSEGLRNLADESARRDRDIDSAVMG